MQRSLRTLAAFAALAAFGAPAFADGTKPKPLDPEELKKDRKQFADFEKTLEDFKPLPTIGGDAAFMTLYRKPKEQKLLAALPHGMLDQPFFFATSVSGGTSYAGWQWEDKLVRLERFGKRLLLVELNTRQRARKGKPVAEVVRRTYANRLLAKLDIKSVGPKGELLFDLGGLLTSKVNTFFGYTFSLQTSLARFVSTKAFPHNLEIGIQMPLYGAGTFTTIHYSISRLPDPKAYTPRVADDRIGYFYTAIRDYTDGDPREGRMVRYLNRWKLEKADPTLALSPPKEPIVFYIEKTVPIAYRRAVRDGILAWNQAFEKIGIVGAIDVRQQTETQFANLDPEDVRYNFFRWITSEEAFAMGPSRVDPRNGRILDADIIFDDAMLRGYMRDYDVILRDAPKKMLTRKMARWLDRHPEQHPLARERAAAGETTRVEKARALLRELRGEVSVDDSPLLRALGQVAAPRRGAPAPHPDRVRNGGTCRLGVYMPQQAGLLRLALGNRHVGLPTGASYERYMSEIVKETVMHEVGHTLGLRHNFKASSLKKLSDINNADPTKRPRVLSASVMDYHPVNLCSDPKRQGYFLTQTIGPYDELAIQYGYALVKEQSKQLKQLARQVSARGLPYGTDEDLSSPDPMIVTWDLGDDPIAFADDRVALVQRLWKDLERRAVDDDQSYSHLRQALNITLFEVQMSTMLVSREVGGLDFNRDHRGDPKARLPIRVVDAKKQRAALKWISEHILRGQSLKVPPTIQDKLAASRWIDWSSRGQSSLDYALMDRLHQIQAWALFAVTADDVLSRVWENEQRVLRGEHGADPLTLPELFDTLEGAIFNELDEQPAQAPTAAHPAISSLRQSLQDAYVQRLITLSLGTGIAPPVANKLAWSRLRALEKRFAKVLARAKLDPYTRAHLETLRARSDKVRAAEYVHLASGGAALCSLMRPADAIDPGFPLAALGLGLLTLLGLRRRWQVTAA